MNATQILLAALLVMVVAVVAIPVSAHIEMLDPQPRHTRTELKDGPCGLEGGLAGPIVATYEPGQTIDIRFDEFVDHPGHYRVAIDMDGHDNLDDPICMTNCVDRAAPPPTFRDPDGVIVLANVEDEPAAEQTITVTLPNETCDHCTLQLIQVMYDKRPYTIGGNDLYYRCADIRIVATASDAGTPDAGDGSGDAGARADTGITDAGQDDASANDSGSVPLADANSGAMDGAPDGSGTTMMGDGGCSTGSTGGHSAGWLWGAGLALVWRRRVKSA